MFYSGFLVLGTKRKGVIVIIVGFTFYKPEFDLKFRAKKKRPMGRLLFDFKSI